MPRFYINFRNGDEIAKDDIGIELPSLEEARVVALISARETLSIDCNRHCAMRVFGWVRS
jgi:hypothetical protein